ncbi:MAG: heavy metal RND transporter [Ancylobacter novellus]|jgi:hypothetical protein|uniref:Heavy metal RND transporter n=1 Tax=Ancylobacter novellus TaxID=921 RepID=A0A2W5KBV7_ANCNO|nr:MAG: heavy metal RND transporter [Ancylobacter novellus]
MNIRYRWRAPAATLAALLAISPIAARADSDTYEFQLIDSSTKAGEGVILAARLINKRSGKPVSDAVIFAWRIDMAPDGMPTMTGSLEPHTSDEPGVYRFKANLTMEGAWRLSLAAKVQGESQTIVGRPLLQVQP